MPENAAQVKLANVRRYGATVRQCVPTLAAREAACAELLAATGATLVHPFDDATVIAGQGTAALELLAQVPELDAIVTPVGGGGLLSGTAIAAKSTATCHRRARCRTGERRRRGAKPSPRGASSLRRQR